MADRESSCVSYSGLVEKYIGSAYDVVYAVYLALGDIQAVADLLTGFGVIYYGIKTEVPLTRNDGSPRQEGDMYFNDSFNMTYVYSDAEWIALGAVHTQVEVTVIDNSHIIGNDTFVDLESGYRVGLNNITVFVNGVQQFSQLIDPSGGYIEQDDDTIRFPDTHLIEGDIVVTVVGSPVTTINPNIGVTTQRHLTTVPNQQVVVIPNGMTYVLGEDNLTVHLAGLMQYEGVDYFETNTSTITFANPIPDVQTQVIFRKGNLLTNTALNESPSNAVIVYDLGSDFYTNVGTQSLSDVIYLKAYVTIADGDSGHYVYDPTTNKVTADGLLINDPTETIANQGTGIGFGCWIKQ